MREEAPATDAGAGALAAELTYLHGGLAKHEYFWRDRQPWLQERGYMLRPRYTPDWKPSWLGTTKHYSDCEDGQSTMVSSSDPAGGSSVFSSHLCDRWIVS